MLNQGTSIAQKLLMLLRLINGADKMKVNSGLKNVAPTHLVLASGKLVLQKTVHHPPFD